MRKLLYLLLLCSFLGLTGCDSKEEAMATVVEAPCKEAGVNFTLNGLWVVKSEEEANMDILAGQKVVLSAYQQETGAGIDIICEDLTRTEGGTLVRMDDYVADVQEQLKISEEFSYSCSEVSAENVYGEEYQVFTTTISELGGQQKYFIRRQDDTMIIMVITVFEEEKIEDILALGKEM